MKPSNKVIQRYLNLVKDGYYLRPCVYDNTTIVQITKDMQPSKTGFHRRVFGEVNENTSRILISLFNFNLRQQKLYFGYHKRISNNTIIQTFVKN